jgi:hypothetical protein
VTVTNTFSQLPGLLNLGFAQGEDFSFVCDFDISLVGYTVESKVVSAQYGDTVVVPTTTVTNDAEGLVSVSFTSEQTSAIPPGTYRWQMAWTAPGDIYRQVLAGFVEVRR